MTISRTIALALLLVVSSAVFAADRIAILPFPTSEFSPARGGEFQIPFSIKDAATVSVRIYSPDGQLVRTLQQMFEAGDGVIVWNGHDEHGNVVPDEAYAPVVSATFADGKTEHIDSRQTSGGETIDNIPVRNVNDHDIEYRLPAPARVLIRVGIAGGPMISELASWEPRGTGSNIQRWDGRDADGVERVAGAEGLKVLVTAYELPDYSIITSGNALTSYSAYHSDRGWEDTPVAQEDIKLERNGMRVSRYSYQSRAESRQPRVEVTLVGAAEKTADATYTVTGPVNVRVNVPKEDRWLLHSSGYEIAFFVDHVFLAEEETGYVPLTWRWDPVGVKPGAHTMTVNVSGFVGQVGVKRLRINLPPP